MGWRLRSPPLFIAMTRRDFVLSSAALAFAAQGDGAPKSVARLTKGWEHYRGQLGGIWEVWRGDKASDNVTWTQVELPHCFNARDAVDPDEAYYQGPGWYRTHVAVDNPFPNGRTLLHFEGAGQKTEVWAGQKRVGRHVGGYDEWTVDITDAAAGQKNVPVAIFCDNSRDLEMIPSSLSDFNLYGGLYRYVNLRYAPAVSIERVHVRDGVVSARLYNPAGLKDEVSLDIRITNPAGKVVHTSSKRRKPWVGDQPVAQFKIDSPELWSPAKPSLYKCTVNGAEELFGIRTVEWVDHGPFKLNGERLLLRGTCRHEDHAGLAAAMTEDLIRKEMLMIKDMGANFIRLGHYQQSRIVLDLCDELGLLVWEEIPWCRGGVGGDRYREQARGMMRAMIDQHSNHPSVILWGLGNENDWPGDFDKPDQKAEIRAFMTELNTLAHSLDPSRQTVIRRCDFAADIPDVYSPSIWAGWYSGRYTEYKASSEKEMKKVRHFIHAEWGGDSHAGRHAEDPDKIISQIAAGGRTDERGLDYLLTGGQTRASKDGDWSESYICNLYDWHLKEQETMPWLTGALQWIFKDFSTPLRPENPVPRVNQKGLVERDLTPKEGFYVFQSYWTEKPMAHIYGHSWPMRWGNEDEPKMVKVYSNCPSAELFVNGVSCGKKTRNSQDFPAAGLRWMVKFDEGNNRIKVVARKGGVEVPDEITTFYQTRKFNKPTHFELSQSKIAGGLIQMEAWLMDAGGIMCVTSRNAVRFELAGDGLLIDNLGIARGSRKVELCNGRAYINVNPRGGKSVVSIASPGLPTAFLTLS
jgi:beta-galactosidase